MKKLITAAFAALLSISAFAQPKTVNVVWPFAAASTQAVMIRSLIENANAQQNKYQFVFFHKPGAGGAVGAKHVEDTTNELTVLASGSSLYIRPLLYKDSHNPDNFNMIGTVCLAQPLAIFSKKLNKITDKPSVTVGVLPGSITTLLTRSIKNRNPSLDIVEVPYKGTPEASSDMLGGHIDGSVDFFGKSVMARFGPEVKVLGITGTRNINNYPTFRSQGIRGAGDIVADFYVFTHKSVPVAVQQELHNIFKAANTGKAREACEDDFGQSENLSFESLKKFEQEQKEKWVRLTQGMAKE